MIEKVLITGGAGFIGSHLADALLEQGHRVTVYDNLHPQIHGPKRLMPSYLNNKVRFIKGDVRDASTLKAALEGQTIVFHFAAYTGVGQSMYQIQEYLDVNVQGTATLTELLSQKNHTVRKLILASSRAVYGEGAYACTNCGIVHPFPRTVSQLRQEKWEVLCPRCSRIIQNIPTSEEMYLAPHSIYAISKQTQEQVCRLVGETYDLPTVILRFFNVYGPRQSLQNPYTGVINVFLTRLMNGKPLHVYEDGQELRDFVHVSDIIQACIFALEKDKANFQTINVGTGEPLSLLEIARVITKQLAGPSPIITGQFRVGDIRHCYADITQAKNLLGFQPLISFEAGISDYIKLVIDQQWDDLSHLAEQELVKRGLS
jgi:dTDP-L-rhamnose 4-epimerase